MDGTEVKVVVSCPLKDRLNADLKAAMIAHNTGVRDAIRVIKAEISREEAGLKNFDDEGVIRVIRKSIKNLEMLGTDAAKEEITILEAYVPIQMSTDEIQARVSEIIAEAGTVTSKDIGRVIGLFNAKYKGMADGKTVSEFIKKALLTV